MLSHITKEMKEKKRIKTKIVLGYVVKVKVGEIADNKMEVRVSRMSKEVVGCVQAVLSKKRFLSQLGYG